MPAIEPDAPMDVVVVGAHPDDVEIACGGTLAKLVQQGYRVAIVDLTDGEPTPICPTPSVRREEAMAAADTLGVHERIILDLPNRRLFDTFETRVALGKQIRRLRPRLVIGFGDKTPMASPDHWQAMQITDAGIFYSRLTKWDDHFDGLPVHTVDAQLYFQLGFDPFEAKGHQGQLVVDIGDTLALKIASVRCYQTQFPPAKEHVIQRVQTTAQYVGATAGFAAGEVFSSSRVIRSTDLMKSVFPGI